MYMNKKLIILVCTLILLVMSNCNQDNKDLNAQEVKRDRSITKENSLNGIFLDSIQMERFIASQNFHDSLKKRIRSFYNARNYQYAWFFNEGLAEYASSFYDMYNEYLLYSGDSSLSNKYLQIYYDSLQSENFLFNKDDSIILKTELLLTAQFFRYARWVYAGDPRINAKELNWYIPQKKINTVVLLDSMLANKGKDLSKYEPLNRQYGLLKQYVLKYYEIEKTGSWNIIKPRKTTLKLNDTSQVVIEIKRRLFLTGDLGKTDSSHLFNRELELAVKNFQYRYGFKEDGIISVALLNEMNRPVKERLQQLLINMERIRWMPAETTTDYLLVNIPEFKLHVYEKGNHAFNMNVVVGTSANNTVIFNGTLKYIVFSPYWNVPASILRKEILPALQRNRNYLEQNHMEWFGGGVRQKPGPWNALGLVKFLFPNNYSIYLHDTPSKSLFKEEKRTFSHGCIRIAEPFKLAQFLLRNDPAWDSSKISKAMHAGKEQTFTVKQPIPVVVGYFTAWVDRDGQLNFRNDVYGHDKKMKGHLFFGVK